ncbi:hypothetical protein GCM10009541_54020 [Micromonospora gifhornensis]|uniref:Uncharacterized protein n=1 Tax=Micromonospora gifhornensis TaxID=84594 RepID=A0ABQ4IKF3_9ACTN|nr:hypothetical protein [Micromonospora gifhornensis]GIJ18389.1 hypothetical protein Vgi01_50730 [Micromonospora gifhornensis]
MDLRRALDIVAQPWTYFGVSDAQLCADVQAYADDDLGVRDVPALDGEAAVRPLDVLLRLAVATKPQYQTDLYEAHRHWSLLRYLGLFDSDSDGYLCLSSAGRRIVGNQRRVTSEELGIGFAVHRAQEWMAARWPGATTTGVIDIDVALSSGVIRVGGVTSSVVQRGRRRPDYLLIAESPGSEDRYHYAVVECKGTKGWRYGLDQLASACVQLRGVAVESRQPPGLAVGTVLADDWVYCRALELSPGRRGHHESATDPVKLPEPFGDAAEVHVEREAFERIVHVDMDEGAPLSAEDLVGAGMQASWASLADFAGNDYAFRRWAPPVFRANLDRDVRARPQRVERQTRGGLDVVGVRNLITLPGGELEVVFGLAAEVDEALADRDADRVIEAQRRVAGQRAQERDVASREPGDDVTAVSDDGAVLMLIPR